VKLGILGGTFDPIHKAHLLMAERAIREFSLNYILVIPSACPPHKRDRDIGDFSSRYDMCVLATKDYECMFASPMEANREGFSYTIDTLKELGKEYPGAELYFIIGGDTVFELETWKSAGEVFPLTKFIAFNRHGLDKQTIIEKIAYLHGKYNATILLSNARVPNISSTQIRELVLQHKDIKDIVPIDVVRYINEHGLYRK
jgi:nicotinate-nucleotide adenylyltransferase